MNCSHVSPGCTPGIRQRSFLPGFSGGCDPLLRGCDLFISEFMIFLSGHQELADKQKPPTHQGGGFPLAVENFCFSDLSLHIEPETLVPDSRHLTSPSQVARPPLGSHS